VPASTERESSGLRAGANAAMRVTIPTSDEAHAPMPSSIVLVDTSASRALDMAEEMRAMRAVLGGLSEDARVAVAAFDQRVALLYDGKAGDADLAALEKAVRARTALGASDLVGAIEWAGRTARARGGAVAHRVVLVTDGLATAGDTDARALSRAVAALGDANVERVDALAIGGLRDTASLEAIARGGLAKGGVVVEAAAGPQEIARRLGTVTLAPLSVSVDGAQWSHPTELRGAQPGDEVLVFAQAKKGASLGAVHVGQHSITPLLREAVAPLVERAVAVARISDLEEAADVPADVAKSLIIELSRKHRIISRHTSLLVLETEADYVRFGIDRKATVDVMTVRDGRVLLAAHARDLPKTEKQEATAIASTSTGAVTAVANEGPRNGQRWGEALFGPGGVASTSGDDGAAARASQLDPLRGLTDPVPAAASHAGPSASGSMPAPTRRSKPAPMVRMGASMVSGRVPPETVQRIVRQNFGRFRACYQAALLANPKLKGRVTVDFIIPRDGIVTKTSLNASDINAPTMEKCVVEAFKGLAFAGPDSGIIRVTYPIVFSNDADAPVPEPVRLATARPRIVVPDSFSRSAAPASSPPPPPPPPPDPYLGDMKVVMMLLEAGDSRGALAHAVRWRARDRGDVMALVALGEAAEARGDDELAERAYASILELWPDRADMRRFSGERLERVGTKDALALAIGAYRGAVVDRPDHPSGARLLAFALVKSGELEEAFHVLAAASKRTYPAGRFEGVTELLREDLGIVAAAWLKAEAGRSEAIRGRVREAGAEIPSTPSLRVALVWETDANDMDLRITDGSGAQASYIRSALPAGGALRANVTNGFGSLRS
jgi:hypothetical protein